MAAGRFRSCEELLESAFERRRNVHWLVVAHRLRRYPDLVSLLGEETAWTRPKQRVYKFAGMSIELKERGVLWRHSGLGSEAWSLRKGERVMLPGGR